MIWILCPNQVMALWIRANMCNTQWPEIIRSWESYLYRLVAIDDSDRVFQSTLTFFDKVRLNIHSRAANEMVFIRKGWLTLKIVSRSHAPHILVQPAKVRRFKAKWNTPISIYLCGWGSNGAHKSRFGMYLLLWGSPFCTGTTFFSLLLQVICISE